jgi:hypothetical protein
MLFVIAFVRIVIKWFVTIGLGLQIYYFYLSATEETKSQTQKRSYFFIP